MKINPVRNEKRTRGFTGKINNYYFHSNGNRNGKKLLKFSSVKS
jgi:hypothetical protein